MIQRLQQKRNEEGFTLIELLIVIIVLGILAAIVVFAVGSTRSDAVQSACKTDVKAIELSAEAVLTKTGSYPAGAISEATASNPLVAPANGALLKSWPTNADYELSWSGGIVTVYKDFAGQTANVYDSTPVNEVVSGGCSGLS